MCIKRKEICDVCLLLFRDNLHTFILCVNSSVDQHVTMDVIVKIAPKVATHWIDIGYCLQLLEHDIDIIETESQQDLRVACRKMLRKWLSSARGRSPKTWRTFIQALLDLDIDPNNVIAVLEKEPVQNN